MPIVGQKTNKWAIVKKVVAKPNPKQLENMPSGDKCPHCNKTKCKHCWECGCWIASEEHTADCTSKPDHKLKDADDKNPEWLPVNHDDKKGWRNLNTQKVVYQTECIACGGTGKNSKGGDCYPCSGTGQWV